MVSGSAVGKDFFPHSRRIHEEFFLGFWAWALDYWTLSKKASGVFPFAIS